MKKTTDYLLRKSAMRVLYETLAILAMKMHLKLQLKDSVVLVTWLGMYPGIPWLPYDKNGHNLVEESCQLCDYGVIKLKNTLVWLSSQSEYVLSLIYFQWFYNWYLTIGQRARVIVYEQIVKDNEDEWQNCLSINQL